MSEMDEKKESRVSEENSMTPVERSASVVNSFRSFFTAAEGTAGRPQLLPPKSKEEAEIARKQMGRLSSDIKRQLKKDLKEQKKKDKSAAQKEARLQLRKKVWLDDILPDWDKKKGSKEVRNLLHEGVPPAVRDRVWCLVIGNELAITEELYRILGQRAERSRQDLTKSLGKEGTVELVSLDLDRTFPALSIFHQGGPLHDSLREILENFVSYRPDVGYVQGMSVLAAVFLLYMEPYPAFVALVNMINQPFFMAFFRVDMIKIAHRIRAFKEIFSASLPDLFKRFDREGVAPETYIMDWCLTLFAKSLDLDVAARIWDSFFAESMHEYYIFRAAIGLLKTLYNDLMHGSFEDNVYLLTHLREVTIDVDVLCANIDSISLTNEKYEKLLKKFDPNQ